MSNARFGLRVRNGLVRSITEGQQAIFLDPDAVAFLTAAGITDSTIISAINTLVVSLKNFGIWTKMMAIYPFVGGTASTHKWNLKDPRDLDIAFRLIFSGGITHSSTGLLFNGTNGSANTYFFNSASFSSNIQCGIGLYSRTLAGINGADMGGGGTVDSGTNGLFIYCRFSDNNLYANANAAVTTPGAFNLNGQGFYAVTRNNTNGQYKLYKRHSSGNITQTNSGVLGTQTNTSILIGAGNDGLGNKWSNRELALAYIDTGLTDTDVNNLASINLTFQTTLSRQV